MLDILRIILPVFVVVAGGYGAARANFFQPAHVDGVLAFAMRFGVPCLLFLGMYRLDLHAQYDWRLLVSFYAGALLCFALGALGAWRLFGRRPGESVAIGFAALFSNSLLLGLPITQRAYGADAVAGNYVIISIHAPLCYLVGILAMETVRADGRGVAATLRAVAGTMFRNALTIGLALGLAANASGFALPEPALAGVEMLARAALPAALFGLGGALTRYAIRGGLGEGIMVSVLSLLVHPAIALVLSGWVFALPVEFVRSAVVTAAMAPGINAYVFAAMYQRATAVAASTVLMATAASVATASFWLFALEAAGF